MKILLITPYFAPAWGYGGPPKINHELAKYLVNEGHSVQVITTDALDQRKRCPAGKTTEDNIEIIRVRNLSNYLAWNFKIFVPLGFNRYLKGVIRDFDYVFISDLRDWQNIFTYKLCKKYKIPYGIAAFGEISIPPGFKSYIKKVYDLIWGRDMLYQAKHLFAQTDHEMKLYADFGGKKESCVLLPLGINYQDFLPPYPKDDFRIKFGFEKEDQILLFIGRINYLKGIDILISVMPKMLKKFPKIKLAIIGRDDGYYLQKLETQVIDLKLENEVKFIGPLYGKDNYSAYLNASVFVFTPRHFEETSLSCLGALALGCPVITSNQASIPFLEESKAGFEINSTAEDLEEKLITVLQNDILAKEMGKNGIELIKNVFDLKKVGASLEKYILDVVN